MASLYHGTAAKNLDAIRANGIQPRGKLKSKGNWTHSVISNPKAVYLTDAYPGHFAFNSVDGYRKDADPGLILEVNRDLLSPFKLCPDEDSLEQGTRGVEKEGYADPKWDMKKRTMFYRRIAEFNPKLVDVSLQHLGTCGYYDTIPWSAITRYVLIDWSKIAHGMFWRACDTQVSCMNYKILQDRHRALTRWFFGDPTTAEDFLGYTFADNPHMRDVPDEMKRVAAIEEEIKSRDGLTVVNANERVAA